MTARCPYNSNHVLPIDSLMNHLRKCKATNKHLFEQCKYNMRHIIPKEQMKAHLKKCPENPNKGKDEPEDNWEELPQVNEDLIKKCQEIVLSDEEDEQQGQKEKVRERFYNGAQRISKQAYLNLQAEKYEEAMREEQKNKELQRQKEIQKRKEEKKKTKLANKEQRQKKKEEEVSAIAEQKNKNSKIGLEPGAEEKDTQKKQDAETGKIRYYKYAKGYVRKAEKERLILEGKLPEQNPLEKRFGFKNALKLQKKKKHEQKNDEDDECFGKNEKKKEIKDW